MSGASGGEFPAKSFECFLQQELSKLEAHVSSEYWRRISLLRRCQDANNDDSGSDSDAEFRNVVRQATACNADAVEFSQPTSPPPVSPLVKRQTTCRAVLIPQSILDFTEGEAAGGQSTEVVSLCQGDELPAKATALEAKVAGTEADCRLPTLPGSLGYADALCNESSEPNFSHGKGSIATQGCSTSDTLARVIGELLRITVVGVRGLRRIQQVTLGNRRPDPMCVCEVPGNLAAGSGPRF